MPQVLKDEIRQRILDSAAREFAAVGYERATIASIAARANLGGATLYRYYEGKEQLFDAIVTPAIVRAFSSLLERRVRALGASLRDDSAEELLRFWIDHRLAVVVLLDRAAGTRHERFGERFVETLVALTIDQGKLRLDRPQRFVLRRIFENTRSLLASILEHHADEADIRRAIESFWSYQIAGLRAFADHVQRSGER